jgi:ABC-type sugar transport system ATPase subunit
MDAVTLRLEQVSKRFPGTRAVDRVDFEARAGEVHALMGENGAGKSTLMKILAGAFDDYTGRILIGGEQVELRSPAAARARGIAMIYQELSLAPPLSVAENVLAGRLPVRRGVWLDRRALAEEAARALARVGLEIDPRTPVEDLSLHEAQLVEIAKALAGRPCILVMDEPTSALSREEVERLFDIIRRLRDEGLTIVYISHHLPEIFRIADRVTVMRDGRKVGTHAIRDVTGPQLVEMMIGGAAASLYATRAAAPGPPLLRVERLSRFGFFHDVSFEVRAGEILGLGGLAGAGRTELARSLCGIDPLDAGRVLLRDREIAPADPAAAIAAGLAYLPEDRKAQGLALRMTVAENTLAAVIPRHCTFGFHRPGPGRGLVARLVAALQVHPPEPSREAATLSGGNQQKVLLAKWLATDPEVLVLDEPTRGVDVGAKAVIHRAIADVADRGKAVILISSDLPELAGLSDRIVVLRKGHVLGELAGGGVTEEKVLLAANGELEA